MSIDHVFEIGSDDYYRLALNISGLNEGGHDIDRLSVNFYAYDKETGDARFTCNLSLDELRALYGHLSQYSILKDTQTTLIGKFVELTQNAEEFLVLLRSIDNQKLLPALKTIVNSRLSDDDINTILGRRDSLETFRDMLDNSSLYDEHQWQSFFKNNEWIFGYGLKYKYLQILQREAHISRSDLDGRNEVITDFLLSDKRFTKIVELKTPDTNLFENRRNRADSWRLSTALTDAVSQILAQKANWELEGAGDNYTAEGMLINEAAYDVECILIIGKRSNIEGNDRERIMKLKTLELYRRNLRNIEILLYDELLDRASFIVEGI